MAYGFTTETPMVYDETPRPSVARPDLPDATLPVMSEPGVSTLRKQNTLAKSLPAMPSSSIGDLSFTNYNQIKAYEDMQALAVGQGDRKGAERYNRAVAKAEEAELNKYVAASAKNYNSRGAYKRSEYGKAVDRSAVKNIAHGLGILHQLYPVR